MSTLDIPRTYVDGEVLFASDLDTIIDTVESFLNTTKLTDDNIANGSITGSLKLVNASVTNAKLATDSVATANIEDEAITTAKLNDSAVTTAKIANGAVTNAKLASNSIDSSNIIDGAVTRVKLAAPNYTISSSGCGVYSTTSGTAVAVTNLSLTITLTGRPVLIQLIPDNSATTSGVYAAEVGTTTTGSVGTVCTSYFYLYKDGARISTVNYSRIKDSSTTGAFVSAPGTIVFTDTSGSTGSATYAIYASASNGAAICYYCKLIAIEL